MTHPVKAAIAVVLTVVSMLLAAGCGGGSDPLRDRSTSSKDVIVVGSQDYYSNEIVAEIYAQSLEAADFKVKRDFRIGQREAYVPDIEAGNIDLFPEYSGPLLVYWEPEAPQRDADEVLKALRKAAPKGVKVLDQAAATDQDSYVVTREFADKYDVRSIADLANVPGKLKLGGNSEGENRPNGPKGLKASYGIDVGFTPIEDGGGPLTVKALKDGDVQLAIIYTANPAIDDDDLVQLEDPKGLFLPSHVVPVASDKLDPGARRVIDRVSAKLGVDDLLKLNARSIKEQASAADIAKDWIADHAVG